MAVLKRRAVSRERLTVGICLRRCSSPGIFAPGDTDEHRQNAPQ